MNKKTIITYDNMKKDLNNEFQKVCNHFNYDFDIVKFKKISENILSD